AGLIESSSRRRKRSVRHGTVSEDFPGTRCVDTFAVDCHPLRDLIQNHSLFVVELSTVRQRKIQHEIAVPADDIDEQIDDVLWRLILRFTVIVPLADAGIGLPSIGRYAGCDASLPVKDTCAR